MSKSLSFLLCALLVTGCAPLHEHTYGSWLERVGQPIAAPSPMSEEQAQSLRTEAQRLQAEGERLRGELARETDRVRRIGLFAELQELGDELRYIQRVLREGGVRDPEALPGLGSEG